MSESNEPKLTPEAVKMLNDLAASRSIGGLNLTPDAQLNLEKFANEHLTHSYNDHKNSYLVGALVCFGLAACALFFGLNSVVEQPPEDLAEIATLLILALGPAALILGGIKMLAVHQRL